MDLSCLLGHFAATDGILPKEDSKTPTASSHYSNHHGKVASGLERFAVLTYTMRVHHNINCSETDYSI